jgi:hypothetical protein
METLDKHFRELTRAAFARYGFAYGDVIARWPEIAGEALAGFCRPQRITWPRPAEGRKSGGTLVVEAAPGRALDLQYEVPRIIARINGFYGYAAIATVRVIQGAAVPEKPATESPVPQKNILYHDLDAIDDHALKAALQRLADGVAGRSGGSPQGK